MLGVPDLSGKSFNPSHMRDGHLIHTGRAMWEVKAHPIGSPPINIPAYRETSEYKGGLLIHNLWQRGMDSIHDMCVVNTDTLAHHNKSPDKCLQKLET